MRIYQRKGTNHIDKNRYRELVYFCRQYEDKKKKVAEFSAYRAVDLSRGLNSKTNKVNDSTGAIVSKLENVRRDITLIEQSALRACQGLEGSQRTETAKALIDCVCNERSYRSLDTSVDLNTFSKLKQLFFTILDANRH